MGAVENVQWKQQAPTIVNNKEFASTRLIKHCDIPNELSWHYVEFLFNDVVTPRNKTEAQIKKRYKLWYAQFENLGLSPAQYIDCGTYKQVFKLWNTVTPRVIKLFRDAECWTQEKTLYQDLMQDMSAVLLPHDYTDNHAVCDHVTVLRGDRLAVDTVKALLRGNTVRDKKNRREIIRLLRSKLLEEPPVNPSNLGVWQGKIMWIDVGNARRHPDRRFS